MTDTPYDIIAEQSTLGAMLLSRQAVESVVAILDARDFYVPKHQVIFDAIRRVHNRAEPVDALTIGDELVRSSELRQIGGDPSYLHELTSVPPTASNADYYAGIVAGWAIRRRLTLAAGRIADLARSGDVDEIVQESLAEIGAVDRLRRVTARPVGEAIDEVIDSLDEEPTIVRTPWPEINRYIGGLRPGCLYVIAARPGAGKTMMALQIASQVAQSSGPVAFSSLEMTERDLILRLISLRSSVLLSSLHRHTLSREEYERVSPVYADLRSLPLTIDDSAGVGLAHVLSFARATARRAGKLSALFVDYLQLLPSADSRTPRYQAVGEFTRALRALAKELDCPVVVLSQLNRESEGERRRLPALTDLRESGSIEQDADAILLAQRRQGKDKELTDELDVVIGKNRHGPVGRATLIWEGEYARLATVPWSGLSQPGPAVPLYDDAKSRAAGD